VTLIAIINSQGLKKAISAGANIMKILKPSFLFLVISISLYSYDNTVTRAISGQGKKVEKSRITEITLERKGCYGTCPIYKVTLRSDNTFTYIGIKNVTQIGESTGWVYFDRIAKWMESQGFFNMNDKYAEGWADSEVVVTTAVRDGQRKTVTTYNSGEPPLELWAINAVIDGEISRGMQRIRK
jgi:Domain of unknown function (DUF6438)